MRTTIDIPDEVYKNLKLMAVKENSTVRQLMLDSLTLLMLRRASRPAGERFEVPIIPSKNPGSLKIDNEKIYEIIDFP
jgi:hypothetical protein